MHQELHSFTVHRSSGILPSPLFRSAEPTWLAPWRKLINTERRRDVFLTFYFFFFLMSRQGRVTVHPNAIFATRQTSSSSFRLFFPCERSIDPRGSSSSSISSEREREKGNTCRKRRRRRRRRDRARREGKKVVEIS